ncbi:GNAT family N-acetyltransferase [Ancylobacter sp. Lp-2]|uniref:GNAT family N-acetyltransferase n=1 Tax=Ancylobacter sp. Lp-2 TaxID=2881339 RepID=UPI002107EF62|nr:GNAT family N-acetyltransferase [Ancylobacter sp. Lp-2]
MGERSESVSDSLIIRAMRPEEIPLAIDWAAGEGWNPGRADAGAFGAVDPQGFLIAEEGGAPAAVISVVNYDAAFAFLGFYIVRPEMRGHGIGYRLWQAGLAHAGARSIGLDGVVAQQANYAKEGFALSHRNIRFRAVARAGGNMPAGIVDLGEVPFAQVAADDARVFPAARDAFLARWRDTPGHVGRALLREGRLAGWGVIRPARAGCKIGPLNAEDPQAAEAVLAALLAAAEGGEVFLDVPEPNAAAVALAERYGFSPVFGTARMYRGRVRPVALERLYGVASFELG